MPSIDFSGEIKTAQAIEELNLKNKIVGGHDISDGGLALATAEICIMNNIGIKLDGTDISWLFGENQGLYLLICKEKDHSTLIEVSNKFQQTYKKLGTFGGNLFEIGDQSLPLTKLKKLHSKGLDCFF